MQTTGRDDVTMASTTEQPILVLGGNGKTGRRVVDRLTTRGLPVRVGSRSGTPPGIIRSSRIDPKVASHESALKAHRQNVKRREHNRQLRTRLRGALKDIRAAIDTGDTKNVKDALRATISMVDKMAAKGLIHRNTAGHYKSRLASRVAKRSAAA